MKREKINLQEFLEKISEHIAGSMQKFRNLSDEINSKNPQLSDSCMEFFAQLHGLQSFFSEHHSKFRDYSESSQDNRYQLLYRSSLIFSASMETADLLELAADTIIEMSGAKRGFIALLDPNGNYTFIAARNDQKQTIEKPGAEVSDSVIREAMKLQDDIQLKPEEFDESLLAKSSIIRLGVKALVCVPLIIEHQVKGIVYLDHFAPEHYSPAALGLVKSFAVQLSNFISSSEEFTALKKSNKQLLNALNKQYEFSNIIAKSGSMIQVLKKVAKIADKDVTVLIQGETGTGKDLIARAIHENSPRKDKPFIEVDCGALPPKLIESELFGYVKGAFTGAESNKVGLLEAAEGGTIFLDEINNLPIEVQSKLLRTLQQRKIRPIGATKERPVDFRLISASSLELKMSVEKQFFREDLYYRINTITLNLPPLRERQEDIFVLADHFLQHYVKIHGSDVENFSSGFLKALEAHDWKGNVRELEHIIERSIILSEGPTLSVDDLPNDLKKSQEDIIDRNNGLSLEEYINECKKDYVERVLRECHGKKVEAAKRLKLHRTYLFDLIKKLGIQD